MTTKREFMEALAGRLAALPDAERERLMRDFEEMLDDRLEMGMAEADAVAALGDIDALIRDAALAALPAVQPDDAQYGDAIREIHMHIKNADAKLVAAPLPGGMTAQIEASENDAFTWSLSGGILTIQEVGEARRGLFQRDREIALRLNNCRPESLIADSYGGNIELDGLEIGPLTVLATSSGDISVRRCRCGGRTELTSRSGDLALSDVDVDGDCKLEAMSGDIALKRVSVVSLRLRTASGDAECKVIRANTAALGTVSGDIDLRDIEAAASILCETTSGDIGLKRPRTPDLRLSTASGDIEARLTGCPEGYDIQAGSRSGDTTVEAPSAVDGGRRVQAVSVSGDIEITMSQG